MRYRPEINGLRAVAVLPVILYHAGVPGFSGGFVGVDVFFVISGYLITSILIEDLRQERFSLLNFYERRARRILPALVVTLIACLPFAWAWMTPWQLEDFLQNLTAVTFFLSNIFSWWQTDYFESAAETKPLLHTWSLAVEEQFYLLFPLLLAGLWTLARRSIGVTLWLLAAASFALCLHLVRTQPAASFYLAPGRAWELLAGSLCALAGVRPMRRMDGPLAFFGLMMIVGGVIVIDEGTQFPSEWALLPVGGAVLIILFARPETLCGRLLALRPLVLVGLISYSAYLVHQPLFAFARIRAGAEPPLAIMMVLATLSIGLAWLSWRFVELPFRTSHPGRRSSRQLILTASGAVMAAGFGLGVAGTLTRGWEGRFPEIARFLSASEQQSIDGVCDFVDSIDEASAVACLTREDPRHVIVLLGDSHAAAISAAMQARAATVGVQVVSMTHSACFPIIGTIRRPVSESSSRSCAVFLKRAYAALDQAPEVPIVISARWTLNLNGHRFNNEEGGRESGHRVRVAVVGKDGAPRRDAALALQVSKALRDLSQDHPLVLVGPFPEAGWNVPEMVAHRMRMGATLGDISTSSEVYHARNAPALALLESLASDRISVVDLGPIFCDFRRFRRCVNFHHGVSYHSDDDHPSPHAAAMISEAIINRLSDDRLLAPHNGQGT